MKKEELDQKIWYRALKFLFIASFIILQIGVVFSGLNHYQEEKIYTESVQYNPGSSFNFATGEFSLPSNRNIDPSIIAQENKLKDLEQQKKNLEKNSKLRIEVLIFCIISILGITLLYWVIRRAFFYIFFRETFFKL